MNRPGYVAMAVCSKCSRMAPLPISELIRRYGEIYPVEMALVKVRCTGCQSWGRNIEPKWVRLCEPGCPRQRG